MGLHVEEIGTELVDFSEAGAAVKGMDVVGGEGDRSGIGSWERHVGAFTMVGVTLWGVGCSFLSVLSIPISGVPCDITSFFVDGVPYTYG